jgi:hypothetical protein
MVLPSGNQLENTFGEIHQGANWPDNPGSKSLVSIGLYTSRHHEAKDCAYYYINNSKAQLHTWRV